MASFKTVFKRLVYTTGVAGAAAFIALPVSAQNATQSGFSAVQQGNVLTITTPTNTIIISNPVSAGTTPIGTILPVTQGTTGAIAPVTQGTTTGTIVPVTRGAATGTVNATSGSVGSINGSVGVVTPLGAVTPVGTRGTTDFNASGTTTTPALGGQAITAPGPLLQSPTVGVSATTTPNLANIPGNVIVLPSSETAAPVGTVNTGLGTLPNVNRNAATQSVTTNGTGVTNNGATTNGVINRSF